ncbi:hypothetical protein SUNI508_13948 [Seiridium unicorne]|uniref:Uncharacterized protein n=1 Tax=Seiridium unicorne TaxID=138068 RepID=A0ABR2VA19_9PEZI
MESIAPESLMSNSLVHVQSEALSVDAEEMAPIPRLRVSSPHERQNRPSSPVTPISNSSFNDRGSRPGRMRREPLITFDELPEWHQDNEYIRHGYRPISGSARVSFGSWTYLHNEFMNIWTHLIPLVVFLLGEWYIVQYLTSRYLGVTGTDIFIFTFYLFTVSTCLALSVMYHTLMNHSHEVEKLWLRMDLLGIMVLLLGLFVSAIYMIFWCEPTERIIYWSMIGMPSLTWLQDAVQSALNHVGFRTLPQNLSTVVWSAVFFHVLYTYFAEYVPRFFIPKRWAACTAAQKADWRLRITYVTESFIIGPYELYLYITQADARSHAPIIERIFGYDDTQVWLLSISAGFFAWHIGEMLTDKSSKLEFIVHGIVGCALLFSVYFYLPHYLIYEVTNIFQGAYRIFTKLELETSGPSVFNAVVWILSFGVIRVVQGTYVTVLVIWDLWVISNMSLTKDELSAADWAAFQELSRNGMRPEPVSLATVLFWFICGSILEVAKGAAIAPEGDRRLLGPRGPVNSMNEDLAHLACQYAFSAIHEVGIEVPCIAAPGLESRAGDLRRKQR